MRSEVRRPEGQCSGAPSGVAIHGKRANARAHVAAAGEKIELLTRLEPASAAIVAAVMTEAKSVCQTPEDQLRSALRA